jgi:hypothetical protein
LQQIRGRLTIDANRRREGSTPKSLRECAEVVLPEARPPAALFLLLCAWGLCEGRVVHRRGCSGGFFAFVVASHQR